MAEEGLPLGSQPEWRLRRTGRLPRLTVRVRYRVIRPRPVWRTHMWWKAPGPGRSASLQIAGAAQLFALQPLSRQCIIRTDIVLVDVSILSPKWNDPASILRLPGSPSRARVQKGGQP